MVVAVAVAVAVTGGGGGGGGDGGGSGEGRRGEGWAGGSSVESIMMSSGSLKHSSSSCASLLSFKALSCCCPCVGACS